ncbi:ATP-grasp domain-containing protein [Paraburkholderia strydomiana]|uniref:ATP-grasp domain-containing protein n=1 Tax=Paraburkholderia strydomiana TaxID=1245417 RepID=UPI00285C4F2A|nr:ATP-grasp domain-containing protein [Paraburkholderia strydomiana]MDR7006211.1 biotin carboxylase [Paraburkholderia strydomiana]
MKLQRQAIVIVGADRKGYYIGPALQGRGYQCIHVACGEPASADSDCPGWCTHEYRLRTNDDAAIAAVVRELKQYSIKAIVAAGDGGVIAANALAQHFDVPRNPAGSSLLHRHKYHMVDALRRKDVPCAAQFYSRSLDALKAWYRGCGFRRVVMKPSLGGYSDGVGVCENEAQITDVFERNINRINVVGEIKDEYVIQECLEGRHYVINTVSVDGAHFVTDIWHDVNHHEETYLVDEYSDLLSRDAPEFADLTAYAFDVLDALQIGNGPAHTEVMLTSNGPRLIETGARLAGGIDFAVVEECNGFSQISMLADSIVAPHLFSRKAALCELAPQRFARFIYMSSDVSGQLNGSLDLERFLVVPSLMSIKLAIAPRGLLRQTRYALGHPGYAMLLADSQAVLERDYAMFRDIERSFFTEATGRIDLAGQHAAV